MPPDAALLADVRAWLTKAAADLRAGHHDLLAAPPLFEDVLFHCQQACEKALKGFLAFHDEPFRKTHHIEEVGHQCLRLDASLAETIDRAAPLSEYAWRYRYPGDFGEPSPEEAEQALAIAGEVLNAIVGRLPEAVRPSGLAPAGPRAAQASRRAPPGSGR